MCLLCLLLSGCSSEESVVAGAIEFRAALVQAGGCSFQAEIQADFGQTVETFAVDCQADSDGNTELTVLEPETLKDITAKVNADSGMVTYDGMAMEFGVLADGNVIPAAAPALVVRCWSSEYIASAGTEDGLYRVTYEKDYEEKMLTVDTWFKNDIPISAEVCYNGQRVLKLTITEYKMNH